MKWKKYRLTVTTIAEDFVSNMLSEIGIEAIEIEDHIPLTKEETKGMFIDILPEFPKDDGIARISFYLEADADAKDLLCRVTEGLNELKDFVDLGPCLLEESETEDKDWVNNWKQYFKPFTVDHILIKPTWEKIPKEHTDKLMVEIDPGTAFGTGSHETTQLCIRQLQKYVTQDSEVLDVGTGSGILAITALKLGAKRAVGTDLDENAITASAENAKVNGISSEIFSLVLGNVIDDKNVKNRVGYECYDIVVANILADIIILLQKDIARHLKKGGIFITSGIINTKEAAVREALAGNKALEILETTAQGEWVSFTARRV